jgi:predicted AlkP superfamily pyrophosphatase or phosphodiesterase
MRTPDYSGRSLVNLIAQIEIGYAGTSPTPGLAIDLAVHVPSAPSTVFLLIDGLGYDMVAALPETSPLRGALRDRLDASFSTQTSVATATLATGLPPSQHGLIGYLIDLPEAGGVVNTLWWMLGDGPDIDLDRSSFLPSPNLVERLAQHGTSAVVIEPEAFLGSPLDEVLYRGARTRGVSDLDDFIASCVEESVPGTLVIGYLPYVDAAGHAYGPGSKQHTEAIAMVEGVWKALADQLPEDHGLIGTADHGMIKPAEWIDLEPPEDVRLGGDSRVLFLYGEGAARYAASLPGTVIDGASSVELWGPEPRHPEFDQRRPHYLVFAPDGVAFHHPGNPMHLAGDHGGLTNAEVEIPLLVR